MHSCTNATLSFGTTQCWSCWRTANPAVQCIAVTDVPTGIELFAKSALGQYYVKESDFIACIAAQIPSDNKTLCTNMAHGYVSEYGTMSLNAYIEQLFPFYWLLEQ